MLKPPADSRLGMSSRQAYGPHPVTETLLALRLRHVTPSICAEDTGQDTRAFCGHWGGLDSGGGAAYRTPCAHQVRYARIHGVVNAHVRPWLLAKGLMLDPARSPGARARCSNREARQWPSTSPLAAGSCAAPA